MARALGFITRAVMPAPPGRYNGPHDDEAPESVGYRALGGPQKWPIQNTSCASVVALPSTYSMHVSTASGDRPLVGLAVTGRKPLCDNRLAVLGSGTLMLTADGSPSPGVEEQ